MALEFENCCFCVELRTGSLIIGYLSLVGNLLLTLMVGLGLAGSVYIMHEAKDQDTQTAGTVALVLFIIMLIFIIINLIVNIMLLVGLHKYKRGHVKVYIVYTGVFIVLSIIMFVASLVTGTTAGDIISNLITIVLSIYFLLCIRSYYLKMDDPTKRPTVYNTA